MICATLKEAKAKLNALVDKATGGEEVILMRGTKHVAAIVPITEKDLGLCIALSDAQAEKLWLQIDRETTSGKAKRLNRPSEVLE